MPSARTDNHEVNVSARRAALRGPASAPPDVQTGDPMDEDVICFDDGWCWDDPRLTWDGPAPKTVPAVSNMDTRNTYSVETVLGFATSTKTLLTTNKPAMILKNEDPSARIAEIPPLVEELTEQNGVQEKMKTDLRDQTALVERLKAELYNVCSSGCDKVITAFGRPSEQAKEATNLRKGLKTEKRKTDPTPPSA